MSRMKKFLAIVLVIAMMVPSSVFAATESPHKMDIHHWTTFITQAYCGYRKLLTIILNGHKMVEGVDFVVVGTKPITGGNHTLVIKGVGYYTGKTTISYRITKASKPVVTVSAKTQMTLMKGIKASTLKNSSKKITLDLNAGSTVTKVYEVVGNIAKQYVSVSSNGVVTLKKGAPKGTYKIRVRFSGSPNYEGGSTIYKINVK
ncbi:MAG: hypothetical protein LUF92_07370 [Clostridiales bacterium]|nr:hypothetical protein [Clostridiales bacterium]